jgi:putative transposase
VELNAVWGGLTREAADWPWSSAAAHTGGVDRAGIVDCAEWSGRWTAETWREVLNRGVADAALLERIRESARTGRPAASDDFVKQLEVSAHRRLRPRKRGPKVRVTGGDAQLDLGVW